MEKRRPLIAGNWKMFKTCSEAMDTATSLIKLTKNVAETDIMIAPAFTALWPVAEIVKESNVSLGAQNFFHEKEGAYTGEISSSMLVSAGCRYVIIGHSERRQLFGETDETVNKKIKAALKDNLSPVLCIGETEEERKSENTFIILDKQVENGLKGFSSDELLSSCLVVAYEPVWAIGTGKTATKNQAQEVHLYIRTLLEKKFGSALAESTRILYGGSVKPNNILELMEMPDVDGALVGGASLDAETFSQIVHY